MGDVDDGRTAQTVVFGVGGVSYESGSSTVTDQLREALSLYVEAGCNAASRRRSGRCRRAEG